METLLDEVGPMQHLGGGLPVLPGGGGVVGGGGGGDEPVFDGPSGSGLICLRPDTGGGGGGPSARPTAAHGFISKQPLHEINDARIEAELEGHHLGGTAANKIRIVVPELIGNLHAQNQGLMYNQSVHLTGTSTHIPQQHPGPAAYDDRELAAALEAQSRREIDEEAAATQKAFADLMAGYKADAQALLAKRPVMSSQGTQTTANAATSQATQTGAKAAATQATQTTAKAAASQATQTTAKAAANNQTQTIAKAAASQGTQTGANAAASQGTQTGANAAMTSQGLTYAPSIQPSAPPAMTPFIFVGLPQGGPPPMAFQPYGPPAPTFMHNVGSFAMNFAQALRNGFGDLTNTAVYGTGQLALGAGQTALGAGGQLALGAGQMALGAVQLALGASGQLALGAAQAALGLSSARIRRRRRPALEGPASSSSQNTQPDPFLSSNSTGVKFASTPLISLAEKQQPTWLGPAFEDVGFNLACR